MKSFIDVKIGAVAGKFEGRSLRLGQEEPDEDTEVWCWDVAIDTKRVIVVAESLRPDEATWLATASAPPWADTLVGSTLLSGKGMTPRIHVDVIVPVASDHASIAFAAACATSFDHEQDSMTTLVRVADEVVRVASSRHLARWSGTVERADELEAKEMARWAFIRSLSVVDPWHGVWEASGFRLDDDPRTAGRAYFGVVRTARSAIAVFSESMTEALRREILASPRPSWFDAIAVAEMTTEDYADHPRARVVYCDPLVDRTEVAAAVAFRLQHSSRADVLDKRCVVEIDDDQLRVSLDLEFDDDASYWTGSVVPERP